MVPFCHTRWRCSIANSLNYFLFRFSRWSSGVVFGILIVFDSDTFLEISIHSIHSHSKLGTIWKPFESFESLLLVFEFLIFQFSTFFIAWYLAKVTLACLSIFRHFGKFFLLENWKSVKFPSLATCEILTPIVRAASPATDHFTSHLMIVKGSKWGFFARKFSDSTLETVLEELNLDIRMAKPLTEASNRSL